MKRIFAVLMTAALMLTSQPGSVMAAETTGETETTEGCTTEFDAETGTLTISGTGACYLSATPEQSESVTKMVVAEGITSIHFYGFKNISQVSLPNTLTEIKDSSFANCEKLTEITIPQSVTTIGDYAFSTCNTLEKVVLHEGLKSIGTGAFYQCEVLKEITLPQTIEQIGDSAFSHCSTLSEIEIPSKVQSINPSTFDNCKSLKKVVLNEGLETIEKYAFYTSAITEIDVPKTVKQIMGGAFFGCNKLKKVILHEGLEVIGSTNFSNASSVFDSPDLNEIQIPSTVKEFGHEAFSLYSGKEPITLPANLEKLGNQALKQHLTMHPGCIIALPASLTYIGEDNFPEHCLVLCTNDYQIEYCKENQVHYADAKEGIDFAAIPTNLGFDPGAKQYEYTGKPIYVPDSGVTYTSKNTFFTLKNGKDYEVSYKNNKNCGTASIIFKGLGLWKGEREYNFEIYRPLEKCDISLEYQETLYNGEKQDPNVTVKYEEEALVEGKDYTLAYKNDIDEGTATVTVTGIGTCQGSAEMTYTIYKTPMADYDISLAYTSVLYDGSSKKPAVTVKDPEGKLLTEGTDYELTYANDTEPGEATVTVTGKGTYKGEKVISYTIERISLEQAAMTLSDTIYTFDGSEKKPNVTVVLNGKTLVQNVDYALTYEANINEGTAYAVVQGINHYTGAARMNFTILPYSSGKDSVYSKDDTLISQNLLYHITDEEEGEVEISSTSSKDLKTLKIPATVTCDGKTYKVTSIGKNAFYKNTKLTSIVIGNNVTSIEDYAFYGCKNVTSIKMGRSVEIIGASSFRKCTKLKSIVLPKSIDELGKNAFYGCKKLQSITINANSVVDIADNAIKGISKKAIIKVPKKLIKSYKKKLGTKTGYKKTMKLKKK